VPKTFNNPVGFERGLWRRKTGLFLTMPKTRVFGVSKGTKIIADLRQNCKE
jgi:hypothetical protein